MNDFGLYSEFGFEERLVCFLFDFKGFTVTPFSGKTITHEDHRAILCFPNDYNDDYTSRPFKNKEGIIDLNTILENSLRIPSGANEKEWLSNKIKEIKEDMFRYDGEDIELTPYIFTRRSQIIFEKGLE